MAQCPKCSASIPDDFGLTECSACRAQLIVHIDGTVEFSGAGSDEFTVPPVATYAEEIGADEAFADEPVADAAAYDEPYADDGFESSDALADEAAAEPEDLFAAEEPLADFTSNEDEEVVASNDSADGALDAYPDFDAPEEPPPGATTYQAANDSPDLSDLAAFGNSEVSGAREGALRYNVRVSGIDTADVRDAFREALTDRKFVWDTDQIVRSIRDGECLLKDVTATKAHVLISRLRTLPVEVDWEQYAIHQA